MLTALERKIRIIKHFVDRTEGFELHHGPERLDCYDSKFVHWVRMPDDDVMVFLEAESDDDKEFMWKVLWPLFLQRAIEGVDIANDYKFSLHSGVCPERWLIEISMYGIHVEHVTGETPDDAKLAALEWIMEKEKQS